MRVLKYVVQNMYLKFLFIVISIFIFSSTAQYSVSSELNTFDSYMTGWNLNIEKASKLLREAENEFKSGDELQGCVLQRKAAKYGIEGTEMLIKAFELEGANQDISNITNGLNKWKELQDFC